MRPKFPNDHSAHLCRLRGTTTSTRQIRNLLVKGRLVKRAFGSSVGCFSKETARPKLIGFGRKVRAKPCFSWYADFDWRASAENRPLADWSDEPHHIRLHVVFRRAAPARRGRAGPVRCLRRSLLPRRIKREGPRHLPAVRGIFSDGVWSCCDSINSRSTHVSIGANQHSKGLDEPPKSWEPHGPVYLALVERSRSA